MRPHRPTLSFTHAHKNICVHGASVNDGWQYDVCVRSKRIGITTWAKSAANSSRLLTKLFLCLLFFPAFFFFFLRGAKQLMVCLWETSKLCCSGKHMHSDARWKRSDDIMTGCRDFDLWWWGEPKRTRCTFDHARPSYQNLCVCVCVPVLQCVKSVSLLHSQPTCSYKASEMSSKDSHRWIKMAWKGIVHSRELWNCAVRVNNFCGRALSVIIL